MDEAAVSVAVAHPNDAGVTAAVPAAASNRRLVLWSTWKTNAQRRGDATMDPPPWCAGLLRRASFDDAYVETPRDFDLS